MSCNVLRCGNPVTSILDVGPTWQRIEVSICDEHQTQIDQGARWLYQSDEHPTGRLLMGQDLPPRAVNITKKGGLRSPEGRPMIFTFTLENHNGDQDDTEFELPPDLAEGLWRILDRDRRKPGPQPAD